MQVISQAQDGIFEVKDILDRAQRRFFKNKHACSS
jgi:hypothetical protein